MRELKPREVRHFAQVTQLVNGGAEIELKASALIPPAIILPPSLSLQLCTFEFLLSGLNIYVCFFFS